MALKEEIWKPINGYEGLYEISSHGRVKSLPKKCGWNMLPEAIRKSHDNGRGYLVYDLYDYEGNRKKKYAHRLVAEHFLDNPNNYPIINHKDESRSNNYFENLEWCDHKYNNNYGDVRKKQHETRFKNKKGFGADSVLAKKVICLTTLKVFDTVTEASLYYNIPNRRAMISTYCKLKEFHRYCGKLEDGTELKWMYYDEYLEEVNGIK